MEIPSPDAPSFMLLFKLFQRILKGVFCEGGKSTVALVSSAGIAGNWIISL